MSSNNQANYSDAPNSPLHPPPDAEVKLPKEILSEEELDFLDLNPDISTTTDAKKPELNQVIFDDREQFKPVLIQSPIPQNDLHPRRLSAVQQTRFNSYVEEQLHRIQRRFIQSLGLGQEGYSDLSSLLTDLKNVVNFVWLSIEPSNAQSSTKSTLFGQSNYLISIANDLLEYLVKFKLTFESASLLLKLLQSLDLKFSKLIDGDIPGGSKILATESIRINGIAERSRLFVSSYFEKNEIAGFHYELSKVYEGVLERTG